MPRHLNVTISNINGEVICHLSLLKKTEDGHIFEAGKQQINQEDLSRIISTLNEINKQLSKGQNNGNSIRILSDCQSGRRINNDSVWLRR